MCGRYEFDPSAFDALPGAGGRDGAVREVRPTDLAPVIAAGGPRPMRWGFPLGAGARTVINAKRETARELPMFRAAAAHRRAAVPTTGFYEWQHRGARVADRYVFRAGAHRRLYLAGLWDVFDGPSGPEERFVVLTAAANAGMAAYHDRMPVCLAEEEVEAWVRDSGFAAEVFAREQPELTARRDDERPEQTTFL